jgi:hypothetical protein
MTDTINHDASLDQEAQELVLVEMVEIQPVDKNDPGVSNSERIHWLEQAYRLLREDLLPEAPERISITFGFPSTGARKSKNQRLGEYAHQFLQGYPDYPVNSGFISLHPAIFNNPSRVLDVLLHEMIHAACPEAGHKGVFRTLAKRAGLAGKMTATNAGPELKENLDGYLADRLPPMPPGYGDLASQRKKQSTRMRKHACPECGQIIRAATDELNIVCGDCAKRYTIAE